jgi:DNA-binding transcriptional LysR family regulator
MGRNLYYKKGIQLPQLRSFCAVAGQETFTAAARALGLSVAAVWLQVRALERELETTLIRRRGRQIEVTPEGRLLLDLIQPHVRELDSLAKLFKMRQGEPPRQLTVASTHYLFAVHLAEPLQVFTEANPSVRLSLLPSPVLAVPSLVEQGRADVGMTTFYRDEPRSPHLEYEPLFDVHLTLLTSTDHPLARRRKVALSDVVRYPMIVTPPGTPDRIILDRLRHRHQCHEQLHVAMEVATFDLIGKYAALGIGVALVYQGTETGEAIQGLRRRVFDPHLESMPVAFMVCKGAYHSEPVREFRRLVCRSLQKENPGRGRN